MYFAANSGKLDYYPAMKHRCPVCKKTFKAPPKRQSEQAEFFPFCSPRCKLIDLGAWLDAEYKITSQLKSQNAVEPSDTCSDAPADSK